MVEKKLSLFRQPLLHFLLLGAMLFGLYFWLNPDQADDSGKRIVIDRGSLLEYMQYRNRAFNAAQAEARLAALEQPELQTLIQQYVREEALYREALLLGMNRDDYIIKQRLVQKMEYLTRGFGATKQTASDTDIETYYQQNREHYREPATATFSHVFLAKAPQSEADARLLLQQLNRDAVPFSRAMSYGDRFPYHTNYVERSRELIASHFDDMFAENLFSLNQNNQLWQGPIASGYGEHLVMLTGRNDSRIPPLPEIYGKVKADYISAQEQQNTEAAVAEIIGNYQVQIDSSLLPGQPVNSQPSAN